MKSLPFNGVKNVRVSPFAMELKLSTAFPDLLPTLYRGPSISHPWPSVPDFNGAVTLPVMNRVSMYSWFVTTVFYVMYVLGNLLVGDLAFDLWLRYGLSSGRLIPFFCLELLALVEPLPVDT